MPSLLMESVVLDRFTVRPRHLDAWRDLWPREVALLRSYGVSVERAFVETDAEPKVTRLLSHADGADAALGALADLRESGEGGSLSARRWRRTSSATG